MIGLPLVYLNMVGGQDDQLFDGASFVLNPDGSVAAQLPAFEEAVVHLDLEKTAAGWRAVPGAIVAQPGDIEQDYRAMVMGLHDYLRKSGFSKVVLGLSGGIDSALVAVIAADALGAENVHTIRLPSPFTSQDSLEDAEQLAAALGIRMDTVPITPLIDTATSALLCCRAPCAIAQVAVAKLAELTVFYCEEVFDFLASCGTDDEGFYDALVRMFEQALKYVLALPAAQQAAFLARLDRVRLLGQNVGWGVGSDFNPSWSEAGLAGDES